MYQPYLYTIIKKILINYNKLRLTKPFEAEALAPLTSETFKDLPPPAFHGGEWLFA